MTTPDPFLDTASQRQATGMDTGARKLMLNVIANVADPSLTVVHYPFDGRFADVGDYLDAVEEVWGHEVAQHLREVVADATSAAISKFLTLTPSADRRVENEVTRELLHMPEPDFRQALWKTGQGTLKAGALAPRLNEVCRNRGIQWEFDSDEGFRWIGDNEVEIHAVRPVLSAIDDLSASTLSSPPRRRTSSWRSTGAVPWPRTPASPRTAPDRTGSSLAAMPGPSPTRTGSRGTPRESEAGGVRRLRLRRPRSRRQPDPHRRAALSRPDR
jgi:hypothetical protein